MKCNRSNHVNKVSDPLYRNHRKHAKMQQISKQFKRYFDRGKVDLLTAGEEVLGFYCFMGIGNQYIVVLMTLDRDRRDKTPYFWVDQFSMQLHQKPVRFGLTTASISDLVRYVRKGQIPVTVLVSLFHQMSISPKQRMVMDLNTTPTRLNREASCG